jgi:hypothetical protein
VLIGSSETGKLEFCWCQPASVKVKGLVPICTSDFMLIFVCNSDCMNLSCVVAILIVSTYLVWLYRWALLAVIKYTYLPSMYPNFIQDIEDSCLLLMSFRSFVDLPIKEHRMTEKYHAYLYYVQNKT